MGLLLTWQDRQVRMKWEGNMKPNSVVLSAVCPSTYGFTSGILCLISLFHYLVSNFSSLPCECQLGGTFVSLF